jgi:hypothetical protein
MGKVPRGGVEARTARLVLPRAIEFRPFRTSEGAGLPFFGNSVTRDLRNVKKK